MTGGGWRCSGELVTAALGQWLSPGIIVVVMKRSHRVALKPTPGQEALFGQHAGYAPVCLQLGAGGVQGWP